MSSFVTYESLANFSEKQQFRNLKGKYNFITHPSSTIVCGKTGSGKTRLVMNLIKIGVESDIWDQIVIISPDNDSEYEVFFNKLVEREEMDDLPTINLSALPKTLEDFFNKVEDVMVFDKKKQTLVVVDDFHTESTSNKFIKQLFTKNRHYGISLIFCTQNFNELPVTVKTNSQYYYFMKDCNPKILENVEAKCGINEVKKLYLAYMGTTSTIFPWVMLNVSKNYLVDKENNIHYLNDDTKEKNIDMIPFNEFKNKYDIEEKNSFRRVILEKYMPECDTELIKKLSTSRRTKTHNEEIQKCIPDKYWQFFSLKV